MELLSGQSARGNRKGELPEETRTLARNFIENDYETVKQKHKSAVYAALLRACQARSIPALSYKTFIGELKRRPIYEQTLQRQGKRAAYPHTPFYWELDQKTPRHGDRPFEIGHIDHTELDIELLSSSTQRPLGRPWATILTDAYSRRLLAVHLTYDPPS